jgi:hypothetical protein
MLKTRKHLETTIMWFHRMMSKIPWEASKNVMKHVLMSLAGNHIKRKISLLFLELSVTVSWIWFEKR